MPRSTQPVRSLVKLVDTCEGCSLVFGLAAEHSQDERLQDLSRELRETLERYGFELRTEIQRIDGETFEPIRSCLDTTNDEDFLKVRCEIALRKTIHAYDAVQTHPLTTHTRAMVQRQFQSMKRFSEQLAEIVRGKTA